MKNSPGPSSERNLPSRRTTTRSHWLATLIALATIEATKKLTIAIATLAPTLCRVEARIGGKQAGGENNDEDEPRKGVSLRHASLLK